MTTIPALEILEGGITKRKKKQKRTLCYTFHNFFQSPLIRKKQRSEIVADFRTDIRK